MAASVSGTLACTSTMCRCLRDCINHYKTVAGVVVGNTEVPAVLSPAAQRWAFVSSFWWTHRRRCGGTWMLPPSFLLPAASSGELMLLSGANVTDPGTSIVTVCVFNVFSKLVTYSGMLDVNMPQCVKSAGFSPDFCHVSEFA